MFKKITAVILVLIMCISFAACGTGNTTAGATDQTAQTTQQTSSAADDGKTFAKDDNVTVSILVPNAISWPYKEDWFAKRAIEEATNVKLDVRIADDEKYTEKFNLLVASGSLPDIVTQYSIASSNQYALQGAFINAGNYLDKMPNFSKYMQEKPDVCDALRASDGNLYAFPGEGQGIGNRRVWIYRKDIFEKNNLVPPTTPDELYAVCKKLKEIYPESYPLASRMQLEIMCPSWDTYCSWYAYYDFKDNKFKYGPVGDGYKNLLVFVNKMINEKLMPPDLYSINTKAWIDLMVQDKTFITTDYVGRIDTVTASGKEVSPDFQLAYMAPINKTAGYTAVDYSNFIVYSKSKNIDNAVKLIDWYYTAEAKELLSWGKEGETYVTADGKKQYMVTEYIKQYGLGASGWGLVLDTDAVMSNYSEYAKQATVDSPQYEWRQNPVEYMQLTDVENELVTTTGAEIVKYAQEQEAQFVLGKRSFDQWDSYVKEVENKGLSKLLDMYAKAYERYKK